MELLLETEYEITDRRTIIENEEYHIPPNAGVIITQIIFSEKANRIQTDKPCVFSDNWIVRWMR